MKWLILITAIFLTSCASLKPIEDSSKEVPTELPKEIQNKFDVRPVPPLVEDPKVIQMPVPNRPGKGKKKTTQVAVAAPVVVSAPVVKKFNPIIGQRIVFAVYAPLGVRAGTLITKVEGYKTINNKEVVKLRANVYNASFFASIFTVNLLIESYVDPVDFKSVRYQVTGQEGKLIKHTLELYDYENKNIIEYKSKTEEGIKKTEQYTHNVLTVDVAQDILSAFWKVASLDFNQKKEYTFTVASGSVLKLARVVKLTNYEDGWILGLAFDANQNPEDRKIYLNTKTHLVDKIEANIKWGKFKVIRVDNE